ncbi:MAG TPA: L,D-transpeptidase [Bacteroidota bacterium]|nr:L,D-transpeptidase [Bacteroidota bacterium]
MLFFIKKNIDIIIIILLLSFFSLALIGYPEYNKQKNNIDNKNITPFLITSLNRYNVLDTVYTEKKIIIEVLLDKQRVVLHKKNSGTDTLLCSTGTDLVKDGIKTNRGIFIVKNKFPTLISKQFNNTECLNWIGFNYGIGFHALKSKGYYWSLGKRPTSHGCIRLSQESAKKLYNEVEIETPIIIHKSDNARIIKFLPENSTYDANYTIKEIKHILKEKLNLLYSGKYYTRKYPTIVLTHKYIGHDGIDIGDRNKVPEVQEIPPLINLNSAIPFLPDQTQTFISIPDSLK